MPRVVLVGYEPETVDFSDPALPPGMTAEKVHAGIALALKQMRERGWEADACLIRPDATAAPDSGALPRCWKLRLRRHRRRHARSAERACAVRSGHQRGASRRANRLHRVQHAAGGYRRRGRTVVIAELRALEPITKLRAAPAGGIEENALGTHALRRQSRDGMFAQRLSRAFHHGTDQQFGRHDHQRGASRRNIGHRGADLHRHLVP